MCNNDWNIDHKRWSKRCSPQEGQHKKNLLTRNTVEILKSNNFKPDMQHWNLNTCIKNISTLFTFMRLFWYFVYPIIFINMEKCIHDNRLEVGCLFAIVEYFVLRNRLDSNNTWFQITDSSILCFKNMLPYINDGSKNCQNKNGVTKNLHVLWR